MRRTTWNDGSPRVIITTEDGYRYEFTDIHRDALGRVLNLLDTRHSISLKEFREAGGPGAADWYPKREVVRGVRINNKNNRTPEAYREYYLAQIVWFFDINGSIRVARIGTTR